MQTMGAEAPTPIVIPVHCAPKKAPCPKCGKHGRRKRKVVRKVRTVAYKTIAHLEITCGEYSARCDCRTTFRNTPEGVLPKATYDNKVRDLVLDRILKDEMNVEQTMESLRREYLLDLSTGFVYDVLRDHAQELDLSEHRRMVGAIPKNRYLGAGFLLFHTLVDNRRFPTHPSQGERPCPSENPANGESQRRPHSHREIVSWRSGPRSRRSSSRSKPNAAIGA
jgi:hypothetical protein